MEALPKGGFRFRDPQGREIPAAPATGPVIKDPGSALTERWLDRDVHPDAESLVPTWYGERPDYAWGVQDLFWRKEGAEAV